MTKEKQKAEELVKKFKEANGNKLSDWSVIYQPTAKQCARIAINEILEAGKNHFGDGYIDYFNKVKEEIDNL